MRMPSVMKGSGRFAKVPTANIPRSQFNLSHGHKTTFDAGYLIPVLVQEILPGDTFNVRMTAFARLSTPVKPIMDNLFLDSHFFFVPNRIIWDNWVKLMGEQEDPGDSIAYTLPQASVPAGAGGFGAGSLEDYMGIPTEVPATSTNWAINALPIRSYFKIWNEWFRDENLQDAVNEIGQSGQSWSSGDGPDADPTGMGRAILQRGKRHDYFTSCLPWAQKGDPPTVEAIGTSNAFSVEGTANGAIGRMMPTTSAGTSDLEVVADTGTWSSADRLEWSNPEIAIEMNSLREAIQIQKLLERDARSGTRYPEKLYAHFGVDPNWNILQRPEYLGGGSTPVVVNAVAQTSATATPGAVDIDTEQGNLAGVGTAVATNHGFVKSFTEHGWVLGLVSVRADLNYQEGVERFWSRLTMYDHYFPVFAHLGEQAVLNKELCIEDASTDQDAFGYQERWAEYKYKPSRITGEFRSNHANTLEVWHLGQDYAGSCPNLGASFIVENPDMDRILASTTNHHFLFDSYFQITAARPMPMYSIPGNMDRF